MSAQPVSRVRRVLRRRVWLLAAIAVGALLASWLLDGRYHEPAWPVHTARIADPARSDVLVAWATLASALAVGYSVWSALRSLTIPAPTLPKLATAAVTVVAGVVLWRIRGYLSPCPPDGCAELYRSVVGVVAQLAGLWIACITAWLTLRQAAIYRRHG